MRHPIKPFADQTLNPAIDRNDPQAQATAIELQFPKTFSAKAWRTIRYFEGAMYLYSYKGKFVATDESLDLTEYGDGSHEAPYGAPRFVCDTLEELEEILEGLADLYDASGDIPGREAEKTSAPQKPVPSGLSPNVLVKLVDTTLFVGIKTYDRAHGSHGRFLISKTTLWELIKAPVGTEKYESDCGDYVKINRLENTIHFSFTWLNTYSDNTVRGFRQDITVPIKNVRYVLEFSSEQEYLYIPARPVTAIVPSPTSQKMIHRIAQDKRLRRAFSKAMRDCFNWTGDVISLHKDGQNSFFFTTRSGFPKCGGLILHEGEKDGHPYVYYSVHT